MSNKGPKAGSAHDGEDSLSSEREELVDCHVQTLGTSSIRQQLHNNLEFQDRLSSPEIASVDSLTLRLLQERRRQQLQNANILLRDVLARGPILPLPHRLPLSSANLMPRRQGQSEHTREELLAQPRRTAAAATAALLRASTEVCRSDQLQQLEPLSSYLPPTSTVPALTLPPTISHTSRIRPPTHVQDGYEMPPHPMQMSSSNRRLDQASGVLDVLLRRRTANMIHQSTLAYSRGIAPVLANQQPSSSIVAGGCSTQRPGRAWPLPPLSGRNSASHNETHLFESSMAKKRNREKKRRFELNQRLQALSNLVHTIDPSLSHVPTKSNAGNCIEEDESDEKDITKKHGDNYLMESLPPVLEGRREQRVETGGCNTLTKNVTRQEEGETSDSREKLTDEASLDLSEAADKPTSHQKITNRVHLIKHAAKLIEHLHRHNEELKRRLEEQGQEKMPKLLSQADSAQHDGDKAENGGDKGTSNKRKAATEPSGPE